jgi:4-hydroxy-3-polyprenylbenzoate decarboxylase
MDYSLAPPSLIHGTAGQDQADSAQEIPEASKILIDATMKWPLPPLSLPKKEFMDQALKIWQEEGLPPLKLKEPWWGINLGLWSDENERHALSAVQGDYYRAGDEYAQRKEPG